MCAKQAKIPQTEWTRSGMDISRTATPLYKEGLTNLSGLTTNPQENINSYLTNYFGMDSPYNTDFLRQYNRAMGDATANNYSATTGGYTSSGKRAYDDQQRYYNDLASRLRQYGVGTSMAQHNADVVNQLNAIDRYYNAYGLGKNYSAIEQQNALAEKANRNWWTSIPGLAGGAIGAAIGGYFGGPIGASAGASMGSSTGNMMAAPFTQDFSSANNTFASIYGAPLNMPGTSNTFTNLTSAAQQAGLFNQLGNLSNLLSTNKAAGSKQAAQNVGFATFTH